MPTATMTFAAVWGTELLFAFEGIPGIRGIKEQVENWANGMASF
jgi:hypothetical protein